MLLLPVGSKTNKMDSGYQTRTSNMLELQCPQAGATAWRVALPGTFPASGDLIQCECAVGWLGRVLDDVGRVW